MTLSSEFLYPAVATSISAQAISCMENLITLRCLYARFQYNKCLSWTNGQSVSTILSTYMAMPVGGSMLNKCPSQQTHVLMHTMAGQRMTGADLIFLAVSTCTGPFN